MNHQSIDKFFKAAAIIFAQLFVDEFGLDYRVTGLYRNELITFSGGALFTDLVFETSKGELLNLEFLDVKLKEENLKKFSQYKIHLQYQSKKPVVTAVISTYPIKSDITCYDESETSRMTPIIRYLIDYYDEERFNTVKDKVKNNVVLDRKDMQYLILVPFMVVKKNRPIKVREICVLINEIKAKHLFDVEEIYLPLILAIKQYIGDKAEKNKLIEVLTMSMSSDEIYEKVISSGVFEQGVEQGLEQGVERGMDQQKEKHIKSLVKFGMTPANISKALNIPLKEINEIISK